MYGAGSFSSPLAAIEGHESRHECSGRSCGGLVMVPLIHVFGALHHDGGKNTIVLSHDLRVLLTLIRFQTDV